MQNKKILYGILIFALVFVLIGAMVAAYLLFSEKPIEGEKSVSITVIDSKGESTLYTAVTDGEYLIDAMRKCEADGLTFDGFESEFGFTVTSVCGEVGDFRIDGSYWSFYVNGEYCNYSISEQPIEDGDEFVIEFVKG